MIRNKVCVNCGFSSFVSDRSLGGKMVCSRCGSSSIKNVGFKSISIKKFIFYVIGIVVLLIIIF